MPITEPVRELPQLGSPTNFDTMNIDKKTQRYDRQLRLWHAHGQAALERAHVCLVNGTASGTEAIKNLVLPGIGAFTVLDDARITEDDIASNFFMTPSDVGQSRAKVVTRLLRELNEDVDGHYVDEGIESMVANNPRFFHRFTIIIVTGHVPIATLLSLDSECWPRNIPLMIVRQSGFVASLRTVIRSHHIVESHPDNVVPDLSLAQPWPELAEFERSFKAFEEMDSVELSHIPFVVILLRLYRDWRKSVGETVANREFKAYVTKQKNMLAEMLGDKAAKLAAQQTEGSSDGTVAAAVAAATDLENWDEAISNAFLAYTKAAVPSNVRGLFDHPLVNGEVSETVGKPAVPVLIPASPGGLASPSTAQVTWPPTFWGLVGALRSYTQEHGRLPLRGTLPDMRAETETYVKLQQIYRSKAQRDMQDLKARIKPISVPAAPPLPSSTGTSPSISHADATSSISSGSGNTPSVMLTPAHLDDEIMTQFCRNAANLQLLGTPSLRDEYTRPHPEWIRELTQEGSHTSGVPSAYAIAVLFRAREVFQAAHRRWPADHLSEADEDAPQLRIAARDVVRSLIAGGAAITGSGQGSAESGSNTGLAEGEECNSSAAGGPNTGSSTPVPVPSVGLDDWVQEFVRGGNSQYHPVAAYIGGVTSQEAIKLITGQFVPVAGLYVYNGVHSTSHAILFQ